MIFGPERRLLNSRAFAEKCQLAWEEMLRAEGKTVVSGRGAGQHNVSKWFQCSTLVLDRHEMNVA